MKNRMLLPILLASMIGCRTTNKTADNFGLSGNPNMGKTKLSDESIGVLMASHGDINDVDKELKSYVDTAFAKNVGIPFPFWFRPLIAQPAFLLSVENVTAQYKAIGPTHYREKAQLQMDSITSALKRRGINGKAYFGANFANPLIETTLAQMQKDGVKRLIVFNKGAQFSWASSGENIGDVRHYLKEHPEWDVEALGYHYYSDLPAFRKVWKDAILRDAAQLFPGVPPKDICLFIGSHGLPKIMTDAGDPAISQMKDAVAWLRATTPEYRIYHGFLNDDFIPGAEWASPRSSVMAQQLRDDGCRNILMDGRLSFTTHHRATLYDLNIEARGILENPEGLVKGKKEKDPNWVKPKVILAPQFDGDIGYGELMAGLAEGAFLGYGDFEVIKRKSEPLLSRPSYPSHSVYIEY